MQHHMDTFDRARRQRSTVDTAPGTEPAVEVIDGCRGEFPDTCVAKEGDEVAA
jgi:hypothetical protein